MKTLYQLCLNALKKQDEIVDVYLNYYETITVDKLFHLLEDLRLDNITISGVIPTNELFKKRNYQKIHDILAVSNSLHLLSNVSQAYITEHNLNRCQCSGITPNLNNCLLYKPNVFTIRMIEKNRYRIENMNYFDFHLDIYIY